VLLLALSFLMVSEVPMFSLKVSKIDIRKNGIQLTLLLLATLFIAWWGIPGIAWSILTYILLSLLTFRKRRTTS
jgi:CDP-diacylglycerol--serine O-phosphatidyltransferase